jgi:hypothetical protein
MKNKMQLILTEKFDSWRESRTRKITGKTCDAVQDSFLSNFISFYRGRTSTMPVSGTVMWLVSAMKVKLWNGRSYQLRHSLAARGGGGYVLEHPVNCKTALREIKILWENWG